MKRFFFLFFLFSIVIMYSIKSFNYDSSAYRVYSLYFDNLSTNNILKYFSDKSVLNIYPHVNPIYSDRVGRISFKVNDLSSDIEVFKKSYLSFVKKNSYLDYNYLFLNGIDIYRLDVYLSSDELFDLLNSDLIFSIK